MAIPLIYPNMAGRTENPGRLSVKNCLICRKFRKNHRRDAEAAEYGVRRTQDFPNSVNSAPLRCNLGFFFSRDNYRISDFNKYGVAINSSAVPTTITVHTHRAPLEKFGLCHSSGKASGPTSSNMATT